MLSAILNHTHMHYYCKPMHAWVYGLSQLQILFCTCVACHTAPAQQPVEHLSSAGGPSPHVPSLKVTTVDLSDIPDDTQLGE